VSTKQLLKHKFHLSDRPENRSKLLQCANFQFEEHSNVTGRQEPADQASAPTTNYKPYRCYPINARDARQLDGWPHICRH